MKFVIIICIVVFILVSFLIFIPTPVTKKQVRFDSNVKVGTIYGDKKDRFNSELKSLFEQNIKEASLAGGSKKLAQASLETIS
jgi:Na+-transporting NADH:ubiquinone oxidoreductase subunit NqrC